MTEPERRALGQRRRLIFQNLANGVPTEQIRTALHVSDTEIDQARAFVVKKINERLFLSRQPTIPCQSMADIRWHRATLLAVLSKMGDLDLSTTVHLLGKRDGTTEEVTVKKLLIQSMDHPEMIEGAKARMAEAHA